MKNKHELLSSYKGSGTAFLMYFLLGGHYGYLGKWGIQLLFWFTLGGFGMWGLIDLFRISGMVKKYNANISMQLEDIEEKKHQKDLEKLIAINK